jgi:hypothetical protein
MMQGWFKVACSRRSRRLEEIDSLECEEAADPVHATTFPRRLMNVPETNPAPESLGVK